MYRLLIVDDEAIIADGLYDVLKNKFKEELDLLKAYSGVEALKWMNGTRIDIVLTDIRMPGLDGMQLLERIKSNWPQCKVVFLTGYSEFDYVYKAIQSENVRYILKTEGYGKVIRTVENVMQEIDRSLKNEELMQKAESQLHLISALNRKEYLTCMLTGDLNTGDISRRQFEQLDIPLNPEKPVFLLLGHIDSRKEEVPYSSKIHSDYSIDLISEQYFSPMLHCVCIAYERNYYLWIIQPKETGETVEPDKESEQLYEKCLLYLKGILEMVQAAFRRTLNISMAFALGKTACKWADIGFKYASLKQLINYCIVKDMEMLIVEDDIDKIIKTSGDEIFEQDIHKQIRNIQKKLMKLDYLGACLESGQKDVYYNMLFEFTHCLKDMKSKNSTAACEIYYSIAVMLLSYINRCNIMSKVAFKIGLANLMHINEKGDWNDEIEYLHRLSEVIFDIQYNDQEKRAIDSISRIQKYISENISEEISLVKLAEMVYFNPSYLSRLFKQITGINISDYINEIRIKKAMSLLKKADFKIQDIAEAVGYKSSTNFSRFFKSVTGLTPQEYRENLFR